MTSTNDGDTDPMQRPRDIDAPSRAYRWTCPFCGKSRINRSDGESGKRNATAALRTHVVASGGDGHGPRNQLPDDSTALEEHVVEVEGEGSYGRSRQ